MGLFWVSVLALPPRLWVTLGSLFPLLDSVSLWVLGGRCVLRREGRQRQGPGGSRTAHCGGPGPPGPAEAARGAPPPGRGSRRRQLAAPQLQPQHLPRPDGAGAARPCAPPASGCSRGVGGGVPAEPKPSRCRSLARVRARRPVGQPLTKSARSASARAAPPMQVRARSPRRKVLGGLPVPTPRACASCILPAAWLPPGRPPPCAQLAPPTPGDPRPPPVLVSPLLVGRWWRPRIRSGSATVKSLDSIKVLLKFSRSAWCSAKSGKPGGRRSGFRCDLGQRQLSESPLTSLLCGSQRPHRDLEEFTRNDPLKRHACIAIL